MILGAAIRQIEFLEDTLEVLGSRITRDQQEGRPVVSILQEIIATGYRLRDLRTSVDWTMQQIKISGMPLGAYIVQKETILDLLKSIDDSALSPDNRKRIDEFKQEENSLDILIESVIWQVELQVPDFKSAPEDKSKDKEE